MTGSPPARSHRPVAILFVVSLVAVLTAGVLTVLAVAEDTPEPCCAGPVAAADAQPSPTSAAPPTRTGALDQCVVGSWRTVDELLNVKFYSDVGKLPMTTSGRYYEFHPDGTGIERNRNVQFVGNHRGVPIRLVANGWREFTWTATGTRLTYRSVTRANLTWSYHDDRGLLSTSREPVNPKFDDAHNYTCAGKRLVESDPDGFRSTMTRTGDYGYYG